MAKYFLILLKMIRILYIIINEYHDSNRIKEKIDSENQSIRE